MLDKELIREAILLSSEHKRSRHDVQRVLNNIDKYVDKTYDMLMSRSFVPSTPKTRQRYDHACGKTRDISVVPFWPDGVVHRLIIMVMQSVIMRSMYPWSCASIQGRGSNRAEKYVQECVKNDPKGTKYVLKDDVRKCYPSVDIDVLMNALRRKIKDEEFLGLIEAILRAGPQGLPIGFYLSQWLLNFFLEPLDWFIVNLDGVEHYVRYMDDIIIFGRNKKKLHRAQQAIDEFLDKKLHLQLKENWQVYPIGKKKKQGRPLDFVGYKQYRGYHTMRSRTFIHWTRQCRRAQKRIDAGKPISPRMARSLLSRCSRAKRCYCLGARKKYYDPIGEKRLKEVVRRDDKRRRCARRIYA